MVRHIHEEILICHIVDPGIFALSGESYAWEILGRGFWDCIWETERLVGWKGSGRSGEAFLKLRWIADRGLENKHCTL